MPRKSAEIDAESPQKLTQLKMLVFLAFALLAETALAVQCPAGLVDLRVDLYDGLVRDKDPEWWEGLSDPYCEISTTDRTFETGIYLENNAPVYNEFYEFGCQRKDSALRLKCYDWDPDFFEVSSTPAS